MAGSQRLRWKVIPLICHRRVAAMRLVRARLSLAPARLASGMKDTSQPARFAKWSVILFEGNIKGPVYPSDQS